MAERVRLLEQDGVLLELHVASMEHLERLLDRFLAFGRTTSSFVVATPVPPRPLPAARA